MSIHSSDKDGIHVNDVYQTKTLSKLYCLLNNEFMYEVMYFIK